MKRTIGEIADFVSNAYHIQRQAKGYCIDLLKDSDEFPTHSIEWDYNCDDTPSIASTMFDADLADSYITKLYVDEYGMLRANLHAYYMSEDTTGVELADEPNVDYVDLLEYINNQRENKQ